MSGFIVSKKAEIDLVNIAIYTQNMWGKLQRNAYITEIDRSFFILAKDHKKGRDCSDIRKNYRKYKVGKHMIFYREINKNMIEIVRVLHDRMDIEMNLSNVIQ